MNAKGFAVVIWIVCVVLGLGAMTLVGYQAIESYRRAHQPAIQQEIVKPTVLPPPVVVSPVSKKPNYLILAVKKVGSTYQVKLNKDSLRAVRAGARVHLNVGYCTYHAYRTVQTGGWFTISPDWVPPDGRVTVGVVQAGQYLASVEVP
jgi:hypothetical protein